MPRATVTTDTTVVQLKTLPEGYVKVKPLSYGQKKTRADKSASMWAELKERGGLGDRMMLDTITRSSTLFDFQNCIVDHNLEDERGNKLNFDNEATLDVLDPRIGDEIEKILAGINGDDIELADFITSLGISSENKPGDPPVTVPNSDSQTDNTQS